MRLARGGVTRVLDDLTTPIEIQLHPVAPKKKSLLIE